MRKAWNDESGMTLQRNHRVPLINAALPHAATGMRVHIRHDAKIVLPAILPECGVTNSVKSYGTSSIRVGIKIVVTDEIRHPLGNSILRCEQKRSTLASAMAPLS
jgi:hypothetical protein